jgi:hypothetical protein
MNATRSSELNRLDHETSGAKPECAQIPKRTTDPPRLTLESRQEVILEFLTGGFSLVNRGVELMVVQEFLA